MNFNVRDHTSAGAAPHWVTVGNSFQRNFAARCPRETSCDQYAAARDDSVSSISSPLYLSEIKSPESFDTRADTKPLVNAKVSSPSMIETGGICARCAKVFVTTRTAPNTIEM